MIMESFTKKTWLVALISLMFVLSYGDALIWAWVRSLPARHEVVEVRGERFHYHQGRFYRPGWFGFGFSIASPPIGAVVTYLPYGSRTVVYAGVPYYNYEDTYYTECSDGYCVVPAPEMNTSVTSQPVVSQSQTMQTKNQAEGATVTINIPNSSGGYTPVTLTKKNGGYVGPQGEFYADKPTVKQLKVLYGD